jgi:hypothetical protein
LSEHVCWGGELFTNLELEKLSPSGFTPWRWMIWLQRLYEIWDEVKEADEGVLEEYAADEIEYMVCVVKERNFEILTVWQNAVEDVPGDKYLSCLGKESGEV